MKKIKVEFSRWPWQGYGWFPHLTENKKAAAISNPTGARFGGGWKYKIGIAIGGTAIIVDLLFGSIRITLQENNYE